MRKVWANALLSDGKILFWYTGDKCSDPYEFYKDFYYADISMLEYCKSHTMKVVNKEFIQNDTKDNYEIFNVLAPDFYKNYKISPDSKGTKPY